VKKYFKYSRAKWRFFFVSMRGVRDSTPPLNTRIASMILIPCANANVATTEATRYGNSHADDMATTMSRWMSVLEWHSCRSRSRKNAGRKVTEKDAGAPVQSLDRAHR
jgi:hypothetical protein